MNSLQVRLHLYVDKNYHVLVGTGSLIQCSISTYLCLLWCRTCYLVFVYVEYHLLPIIYRVPTQVSGDLLAVGAPYIYKHLWYFNILF